MSKNVLGQLRPKIDAKSKVLLYNGPTTNLVLGVLTKRGSSYPTTEYQKPRLTKLYSKSMQGCSRIGKGSWCLAKMHMDRGWECVRLLGSWAPISLPLCPLRWGCPPEAKKTIYWKTKKKIESQNSPVIWTLTMKAASHMHQTGQSASHTE